VRRCFGAVAQVIVFSNSHGTVFNKLCYITVWWFRVLDYCDEDGIGRSVMEVIAIILI
jgi:hypothetical protein